MSQAPRNDPHIRPLDVRRDLQDAADLIELCFASNMDAEGRDYIRYIRRVANNGSLVRWVPGAAERVSIPLHGYVWVEGSRIIGNLTLIPFFYRARWIYLIANVAVHPDYRRLGIGRLLTQRALQHIQDHHVREAWLQVRDDNPVAEHLYLELGFKERTRRTTWLAEPSAEPRDNGVNPDISITPRRASDWSKQACWLAETYPPEVTWNLSFDWRRLRPGFLRTLTAWINGESFLHWSARMGKQLIGTATWEPGRSLSDMIWLAVDPQYENKAVQSLLGTVRRSRMSSNTLTVNYPAGQAVEGFRLAGYAPLNTLIWMSIDLPRKERNLNEPNLV